MQKSRTRLVRLLHKLPNVEEHNAHICKVMDALKAHSLYCNPRKTKLFRYEVDFLGHRISARGIEADPKKVERIVHWSQPKSATNVRAFLGLVRYLSSFLPKLAVKRCTSYITRNS
jgi:hypothetical protein